MTAALPLMRSASLMRTSSARLSIDSAASIAGPAARSHASPLCCSLAAPARGSPLRAQRGHDELEHRRRLEMRRSRLEEPTLALAQGVDQRGPPVFPDDGQALTVAQRGERPGLVQGVRRVRSRVQHDDAGLPAQDVEHAGPLLITRPKVVEAIDVVSSAGLIDVEHGDDPIWMQSASERMHALAIIFG